MAYEANPSADIPDTERAQIPDYDSSVRYRRVANFPDYIVGSDGSIYLTTLRGYNYRKNLAVFQRIKTPHSYGYPTIRLVRDGVCKKRKVHHVVLEAFVGRCPKGLQCAHLDGKRDHNSVNNLIWTTVKINASHRIIHGTHLFGEKIGNAKFTDDDVLKIRSLARDNTPYKIIAKMFGTSYQYVGSLVRRRTWRHLP